MTVRRFVVVRLAWALLGAWLVTVLAFVVFLIVPERPDRLFAGPTATQSDLAAVAEEIGLDEPVHERYASFLARFFTNDAAAIQPITRDGPTSSALQAASATGALVLPALAISLAVGVIVGLRLARRPRSRLSRVPIYFAVGMFPVWVGLLLALLFSEKVGWLPAGGYCEVFGPSPRSRCGGVGDWARTLILPWLTFAIPLTAIYARVTSKIAVRDRRRGLLLLGRMVGRDVGFFIVLSMFIEVTFGVPGLGRQMLNAVDAFAAEWAMSAFLIACLLAIAWHFVVDVTVAALDSDLRREWPHAEVRVPAQVAEVRGPA